MYLTLPEKGGQTKKERDLKLDELKTFLKEQTVKTWEKHAGREK